MTTLDTFIDKMQEAKPQSTMSVDELEYLYEQSYERQVEKRYDWLIQQKLAEERKELEAHKEHTKRNYIRVGGN